MTSLNNFLVGQSGLDLSNLISQTGLSGVSLGVTRESLGITSAIDEVYKEVTDGSRTPYSIPSITSVNLRANSWQDGWSSSESWTNYYNYLSQSPNNNAERAFWYGLGTNNKQNTQSYSGMHGNDSGTLQYATNSVVGTDGMTSTISNDTSYGPFRVRVMFLRNHHPTASQSTTMWGHYSNYWSSGYEGSGVGIGTPNANGSYNNVSQVSWTSPVNRTGGNSAYTWSFGVTIPAQTTVAVVQTNSMYYWTNSGGYKWFDLNKFYNLNNTFSNQWIQPDIRMTHAAHQYNDFDNASSSLVAHKIWNRTGFLFGDR
jgi:hypothetical protein